MRRRACAAGCRSRLAADRSAVRPSHAVLPGPGSRREPARDLRGHPDMTAGPLGILMLDTRFPRIEGDIGNPKSFDFPVIFRTMAGIGPADAVAAHPDRPRVLAALKANAGALAAGGAVGLSTSCGFFALYQKDMEQLSPVPVATSALLLIRELTGRRVSVITASAANLTRAHLEAAGAPGDTPVEGMPADGAFAATFLRNGLTLDRDAVEREA